MSTRPCDTPCGSAADAVNGALRRGQVSWVERRELKGGTWGPWSLTKRLRYAQLVPPGRAFPQITGEGDLDRPFREAGTVVAKLSKDPWKGQRATLRRTAGGWAIVGLNYFAV